jgi:hypothetical protein
MYYLLYKPVTSLVFLLLLFPSAMHCQAKKTGWIKQKEQTGLYRFEVSGTKAADNNDRNFIPNTIRVVRKTDNRTIQTIGLSTDFNGNVSSLAEAVSVIDCNFDGFKDLMIYSHDGGAGPNNGYDFYLYDAVKKRFEFNEALSQLTQTEVDSKNKMIRSSWRDGAASHGGETYGFVNGQFTMLENWNDDCSATYPICHSYRGKFVKGKWTETARVFTYTENKPVFIYTKPFSKQDPADSVKDGVTVSIEKEFAKWAWAEYTTQSATKHGWVKKDELFAPEGEWVLQKQQTDRFNFELVRGMLKVKVTKTDTCHQVIIDVFAEDESDSVLQTGDYNFDGQPDIAIRIYTDHSSITPYEVFNEEKYKLFQDYYLYNASTQVFEKDTMLSKLANVSFDVINKLVVAKNWKINNKKEMEYTVEKYSLLSPGKWLMKEKIIVTNSGKDYLQRTRRLANQLWYESKKIISADELRLLLN